jgi:hypothetical protein
MGRNTVSEIASAIVARLRHVAPDLVGTLAASPPPVRRGRHYQSPLFAGTFAAGMAPHFATASPRPSARSVAPPFSLTSMIESIASEIVAQLAPAPEPQRQELPLDTIEI